MFENVKLALNYFRLKKYLTANLNYSEHAAIVTIKDIRNMGRILRREFLIWFKSGNIPHGDFFGINIENLIRYKEMNPVAAFLAVDWYSKDPQKAYKAIALPKTDLGKGVAVSSPEEIKSIMEKYNIKIKNRDEDTSDIVE